MQNIQHINAKDFRYELPEEKIAAFPLENRDESKLLIYNNNNIQHTHFNEINNFINSDFTIFFNNTRVIPARLFFAKESGGLIEVFLLHPTKPFEVNAAMMQQKECTWKCMIGGLKKWKHEAILEISTTINDKHLTLTAQLDDRENQIVTFRWNDDALVFAEVISAAGNIPLPPYLNRKITSKDKEQYQTVYAKHEGAVAAPTAGLHFTAAVLDKLQAQGVKTDFVTLHVGGGTFQPIKTDNVIEHKMHAEQIIITQTNIENLIASEKICAVGTTSLRTLESLYWLALDIYNNSKDAQQGLLDNNYMVKKLQPYEHNGHLPHRKEVFGALLGFLKKANIEKFSAITEIMIVPSYPFQVCEALITNFHQPETTLMLLVAAFVGDDWKKIYQTALDQNYRFLSYGDSSLLFRNI